MQCSSLSVSFTKDTNSVLYTLRMYQKEGTFFWIDIFSGIYNIDTNIIDSHFTLCGEK